MSNFAVSAEPLLRIGELSRRVGVTTHRLRAWETRYGVLRPGRSSGGFRLYSEADEARVREMLAQLSNGLSAAEAARRAVRAGASPPPDECVDRLASAIARFDARAADEVLDGVLAAHGAEVAMREVIFPYLHRLGVAWERGEIHVGQEHFASHLLERRLLALLGDAGNAGDGPPALLACPPGERHSLALTGLAVTLRLRGRRVVFLGADTPMETLATTADAVRPAVVVLAVTMAHCLAAAGNRIAEIARSHGVALAGAAVDSERAAGFGGVHLAGDPVSAGAALGRVT